MERCVPAAACDPVRWCLCRQVMGVNCPEALQEFERIVDALPAKTTRTSSSAYVPSFMETWVFYQVTKC